MPTIASIAPVFIRCAVTLPTSIASSDESITHRRRPPFEQAAFGIDLGLRELRASDRRRTPDARRAVDRNKQADDEIGSGIRRFATPRPLARAARQRHAFRAGAIPDRRLRHRDSRVSARGARGFSHPLVLLSRESNFYNSTAMKRNDHHLGLLLERAGRVVGERLDRAIGRDGVTSDHWRVLRLLADAEGHTMGELAERLQMNPPTLTKLVDRMVGKSLVQRAADLEDSRRVLVYATDGGLALLEELQGKVDQHHAASADAARRSQCAPARALADDADRSRGAARRLRVEAPRARRAGGAGGSR